MAYQLGIGYNNGFTSGNDAYTGGPSQGMSVPGYSAPTQNSYSPFSGGGQDFNPIAGPAQGWGKTPMQQYQESQWSIPRYGQLGQVIGGMTPDPSQYWQNTMGYARDAAGQAAGQYGGIAQQFGNQMFGQLGGQWNQQLAANPAYAQWQQLLARQGNEASGAAPQYLQDLWARSANERLGGSMGAFGAPASQFAASQFGRLNADAANQYHQQAMQNLGGTIAQGNNYFNPYLGTVASGMANIYAQGVGNAANQGYNFGGQAYGNAVTPIQGAQQALIKRFIA